MRILRRLGAILLIASAVSAAGIIPLGSAHESTAAKRPSRTSIAGSTVRREARILQKLAAWKLPPTPEAMWLSSRAAKCVLFHESTDYKFSPNGWQFQGYPWLPGTGLSGSPGAYPRAVQNHYAYVLYVQRGWEPWSADGEVCDL